MNKKAIDSFVDSVFVEALSAGDLNTTGGDDIGGKDQTYHKMLRGEWFGSSIWPFQQATNPELKGSTAMQASHGIGELAGEVVESILEDSSLSCYSDPNSIGYLINALAEFGYPEYSKIVASLTETPIKPEDAKLLHEIASEIKKANGYEFLVEQVEGLASMVEDQFTEDEATSPTGAQAPNQDDSKEDDNPASADSSVDKAENPASND